MCLLFGFVWRGCLAPRGPAGKCSWRVWIFVGKGQIEASICAAPRESIACIHRQRLPLPEYVRRRRFHVGYCTTSVRLTLPPCLALPSPPPSPPPTPTQLACFLGLGLLWCCCCSPHTCTSRVSQHTYTRQVLMKFDTIVGQSQMPCLLTCLSAPLLLPPPLTPTHPSCHRC